MKRAHYQFQYEGFRKSSIVLPFESNSVNAVLGRYTYILVIVLFLVDTPIVSILFITFSHH